MRRIGAIVFLSLVIVIIFVPLLTMVVLSFCKGRFASFPWPGWSLQWYRQFFENSLLHLSLLRSLMVGFEVAVISTLLGFGSGYALSRMPSRVGSSLLMLITLPAIIPFVLFGFCFIEFAGYIGILRTTFAVFVAHIVVFSPLSTALCYHRFRQLNLDIEDAARELGASEIKIFFIIVGGQSWRTLIASGIVIFVLSWDEYIISWFLSGFNKTYPVYVRNMLESTMSPEINAVGSIITVLSLCLMSMALYLLRNPEKLREN